MATYNQSQQDYINSDAAKKLVEQYMSGDTSARDIYNQNVNSYATKTPTQTTPLSNSNTQTQNPTVYDPTNDIKALSEYQKSSQLAQLQKANQQSLSNLDAEQAKIAPEYYNKRAETSTASQLGAKNYAEFLAQRGQTNSGLADQAELSRNMTLQNNTGSLNTAEINAQANIAKRRTDINNAYANDIAAANAGIDASTMQSLIDAQQRYNDTKLNQANLDRTYNYQVGQDALANARSDAGLTGYYNNNPTMQRQQLNDEMLNNKINRDIAQAGVTGQYNGQQTEQSKLNQANIENTRANTVYQNLVNSNLPDKLKLEIANMSLSNQGLQLSNEAQALANRYYPLIQQGQIDGQTLQNAYQSLVNNGYPAQQASELALQAAQIRSIDANIRQGDEQLAISRMNAANGSSGGGGNSASGISSNSKSALTQEAWTEFGQVLNQYGSAGGSKWLADNKSAVINTLGESAYKDMVKYNNDAYDKEKATAKLGNKLDLLDSRR